MFNIDNFSIENLDRIRKLLKIVLDELEVQGINELCPNKIPLAKLEKEGLFYDEASTILNRIGHNESGHIRVVNEDLKQTLLKSDLEIEQSLTWLPECQKKEEREKFCKIFNLSSEDDLHKYLLLQIEDLSILAKLREIKEAIDKKLDGLRIEKSKTVAIDEKESRHKLPEGTKWENITIRFLNGQEVIIEAKDKRWQTDYKEMGFEDKKKGSPNYQWELLRGLATYNMLSWKNNRNLSLKDVNAVKKRKQLLSDSLRAYFSIKGEPFFDYRKEGAYIIKIKLIPEQEQDISTERNSEIENFRKEQSPEI